MAGEQNPYAAIAEPAAQPAPAVPTAASAPASGSNPYASIAEPSANQPAPDWRDRMQTSIHKGYLSDLGLSPDASQEDIDAAEAKTPAWKKLAHHAALHAVSSSLDMITHPLNTIGGAVQQGADVYNVANAGLEAALTGHSKIAPQDPNSYTGKSLIRLQKTLAQLKQQAQDDPSGLAGDILGQSAVGEVGGGLLAKGAGGVVKGVKNVIGASKEIPITAGRMATNTTAADTRALVRDTGESNSTLPQRNADMQAATDKANASAQAAHDAQVAAINEKNVTSRAAAVERAQQLHSEAVNDLQAKNDLAAQHHAIDAQEIESQNAQEQTATDTANQKAQQDAIDQHAQDSQDAAEVEGTRGQLARKAIELKNRLAQHVQEQAQNVRQGLNGRFQAVRDKIGDEGTEVRPLSDVAETQQAGLSETGDQKGIFKTIIDKAKTESEADDMRDKIARDDYDAKSYDDLPQEHKETVDESVANGMAGEDTSPQAISFGTLRRFSSKLGRAIADSSDDYVSRSLKAVKAKADAMAQQMANSAGVGAEHKQLMKDWSHYKDVYKEPTGPSGSGSQVAQSLNAQDISNATSPFTSDDAGVASRAKQLLVGSGVEGSTYNPKGGRLVDALRDVQRQQAALPKPASVPLSPDLPKPVAPNLKPVPAAPRPAIGTPLDPATGAPTTTEAQLPYQQFGKPGVPKLEDLPAPPTPKEGTLENPTTITPESLEATKSKSVTDTADRWRKLSTYRIAGMIAGTVSLASGFASMLSDAGFAHGAGIGGATGIVLALGPTLLSRMFESERVIKALSKPTAADFRAIMKLPPEMRPRVEQALVELTDKARREGKITGPNHWKTAFQVGLAATRPPTTTPQNPQQEAHYVGDQPAQPTQ